MSLILIIKKEREKLERFESLVGREKNTFFLLPPEYIGLLGSLVSHPDEYHWMFSDRSQLCVKYFGLRH